MKFSGGSGSVIQDVSGRGSSIASLTSIHLGLYREHPQVSPVAGPPEVPLFNAGLRQRQGAPHILSAVFDHRNSVCRLLHISLAMAPSIPSAFPGVPIPFAALASPSGCPSFA